MHQLLCVSITEHPSLLVIATADSMIIVEHTVAIDPWKVFRQALYMALRAAAL